MGLIGVSVLVASVVLLCLRPPAWFPRFFDGSQRPKPGSSLDPPPALTVASDDEEEEGASEPAIEDGQRKKEAPDITRVDAPLSKEPEHNRTAERPQAGRTGSLTSEPDGDTTPKAPATICEDAVPTFSLLNPEETLPTVSSPPTIAASPPSTAAKSNPAPPGLMAPPPLPRPRVPTLSPIQPKTSLSPAPARNSLLPNRAPGTSTLPLNRSSSAASTSSLAPPPTHNSKPSKPSRAVLLTPGHSPLDWARLSTHPSADLRGLGPNAPYLRVTPSMLKRQNGRRGRDAWTVLGGRVYNISPYLPFHPGGEPELLRGAGRDGTRLFGEVHPWVNYEGMLAACMVGILVSEEEGAEAQAGKGSEMEEMD